MSELGSIGSASSDGVDITSSRKRVVSSETTMSVGDGAGVQMLSAGRTGTLLLADSVVLVVWPQALRNVLSRKIVKNRFFIVFILSKP